jgi:hypothetical protein
MMRTSRFSRAQVAIDDGPLARPPGSSARITRPCDGD